MHFIFPYKEVEKESKIVLYGAGDQGYDYYRQVKASDYCTIVAWLDRQYKWYRYLNLPVESPETIVDLSFDTVVVAARKRSTFESIRDDLGKWGISSNRIVWKENSFIDVDIAARYDYERVAQEAEDAILVDPYSFITENRLDIVIRVLYVNDIIDDLNGSPRKDDYKLHERLYKQLMMVQNGGSEPTDTLTSAFFSEYERKSGWKAFKQDLDDLVASMQKEGFKREGFVPVDKQGRLINGAHRIAVAIAYGIDAWIRNYPFEGLELEFSEKWLKENGFSSEEVCYIMNAYRQLMDKKDTRVSLS